MHSTDIEVASPLVGLILGPLSGQEGQFVAILAALLQEDVPYLTQLQAPKHMLRALAVEEFVLDQMGQVLESLNDLGVYTAQLPTLVLRW